MLRARRLERSQQKLGLMSHVKYLDGIKALKHAELGIFGEILIPYVSASDVFATTDSRELGATRGVLYFGTHIYRDAYSVKSPIHGSGKRCVEVNLWRWRIIPAKSPRYPVVLDSFKPHTIGRHSLGDTKRRVVDVQRAEELESSSWTRRSAYRLLYGSGWFPETRRSKAKSS